MGRREELMTHQNPGGDPLRATLHSEAARHEPDRDAMLARVEAGMRGELRGHRRARPPRRTFRFALPLAAVTAGLVAVAAAFWTVTASNGTANRVNAVDPAQTPGQIGTATSLPEPSTSSHESPMTHKSPSPATKPSPSVAAPPPPPNGVRQEQGFLWSDGSIDPNSHDTWGQNNVTIKNRDTATSLDVRLRVALTPGLVTAGSWSTVPINEMTVTVIRQPDALVYEWVLKPGVTLTPGSYIFAGQYSHSGNTRDTAKDTYQVTAAAHGAPVQVYGNFS
jgi:hypothetical protein